MITFSQKESGVLGVLIARGILHHNWQPSILLKMALEGRYDYIRVKIPSTDESVFEKLDKLGMPYCMHSILVRNSVIINASHGKLNRPLRVSFRLYDGSNESQLKQLVRQSWGNRTAINYQNEAFRHWISYQQEIEGSAAYSTEFNHLVNPIMPNWIVMLQNEPIGFVLGKVGDEGFEGIMYSILPAYRGHNYAEDIMLFLKKWCFEQGISVFYNDVVFQNMASLKSIVTESIVPVDTYLNLTINAHLSASRTSPISIKAPNGLALDILAWVHNHSHMWQLPNATLLNIKSTFATQLPQNVDGVIVSQPILTSSNQTVVLKLMADGEPQGAVYLSYLLHG